MPRVSEILDHWKEPYLIAWMLKNGVAKCEAIKKEATDIGTMVDQLVQEDIKGNVIGFSKGDVPVFNCMQGWEKFKVEHPEVLERMREHKGNMQKELVLGDLVGHPDFILGDEVCDLKTSKQISKGHWMQTAQYARMYQAMKHGAEVIDGQGIYSNSIKRISILRLDKATPGLYEYKILEEPFISFWQGKFQARYEAFREEKEFGELMRKKLEQERLS